MGQSSYYFPDSCVPGKSYYLKVKIRDSGWAYRSVVFVGYRPHAAEVIVQDGDRKKVIQRLDLFQKNGRREDGGLGDGSV